MVKGSLGVSEQPVTIKDIEINKKLIDLLKLTCVILLGLKYMLLFWRDYTIFFDENHHCDVVLSVINETKFLVCLVPNPTG